MAERRGLGPDPRPRARPQGDGHRPRGAHEPGCAALDAFALALAAHDPDRTLARGYALVQDDAGELVTGVEAARAAGRVDVRFHDGAVRARVEDDER